MTLSALWEYFGNFFLILSVVVFVNSFSVNGIQRVLLREAVSWTRQLPPST